VKLTIQQEDLQKALSVVAGVVPAKTPLPILTSILMDAQEGLLRLSATNLDVSVMTVADNVTVKRPGRIAVPAAKFIAFARSLTAGEVAVEEKSGRLTVAAGKAVFEEPGMNADEFPALPSLSNARGLKVPAAALCDMIKSTAYAISRDETRPALMGILWEVKSNGMRMVATDAHRLARINRSFGWDVREDRNLIADTQGLLHLLRLAESEESVEIFLGPNQLSFRIGGTELHTRLLDGPFPDYEAVIPRQNDRLVTVDRELFLHAVRRVSITADRMTCQIKLGIERGRMELSATGTDGSRSEDEIQVAYDGDVIEVGFNFNYLQDILRNLGEDSIQMAMKDAQSAVLITPVTGDEAARDVLCLLMPLRLTAD
jgi:DNA polymerase-3 subunit beta